MNAPLQANGSVTARWGVLEWTAIITLLVLFVGALLRQEARMTRQETISENVVRVLDRLEATREAVGRVERDVKTLPRAAAPSDGA